jgi:hypothetical protein
MDAIKSLVESKTFWGAIVGLGGAALTLQHFTLTPADAEQAVDCLSTIAGAAGTLFAIYGRVVASKRIGPLLPDRLPSGVGGLMLAIGAAAALAMGGGEASAQTQRQRPVLTGNPVKDIEAAAQRAGAKVTADMTSIAKKLEAMLNTDEAVALATAVPGVQDTVGAACWASFGNLSAVMKAHPLPLTLNAPADIQALRLVQIALNQVCANPNCGQVWTDAQNSVQALSLVPIPLSLPDLCAKVPAIGTQAAAATAPVQPAANALGAPAASAAPAAAPAK